MSRTQSRITSFKVAYALAFSNETTPAVINDAVNIALEPGQTITGPEGEYIKSVLDSLNTNLAEIDSSISTNLRNFTIDRISKIDLAVLRLAIAESMLAQTPVAVIINESTDIAKKFGTQTSPDFVNGILSKLLN